MIQFLTFHSIVNPSNQIIIRSDKIVSYVADNRHGIIYLDDGSEYEVHESVDEFKEITKICYNIINPFSTNEYQQNKDLSTGEIMRELADRSGIRYSRLAEMIAVDSATLSRYMNNKIKPSKKVLIKFSKIFNVPIEYLEGKTLNADGDFTS